MTLISKSQNSTISFFFFFNDTATTEIYTLSLHDALPISFARDCRAVPIPVVATPVDEFSRRSREVRPQQGHKIRGRSSMPDRKSTRLNSSHSQISYAVFCLKKKIHTLLSRLQ